MPLYKIVHGETVRLVDAKTPAQAVRHVARPMFAVTTPSPTDVALLVSGAVKYEVASADAEPEPERTEA